jgi:UDP-2,3-diacylglucosamine pyrophosphatase LpxH
LRRERDLVALLEWYRAHRQRGLPWRLVIAGDFIDFVGMSVMTEDELETAPTEEEIEHGLGGAPDHTLAKLALVMRHHEGVMRGLAEFVAAGNTLVIVRGNHDVEWHWDSVQTEFRRKLAEYAHAAPEQIEFVPWFYYEEGVVYVEHGHQYDKYCSYEHLLHPVSPADPRRTARSLSDVLLRYVVRPTRGMTESGHDAAGLVDYVRFAVRLGVRGMLALARRFMSANRVLLRLWRERGETVKHVRREHERKMQLLSQAYQISLDRLRRLAELQRPPVTKNLVDTLASVMLDRIALGVLGVFAVGLLIASVDRLDVAAGAIAGVVALLVALGYALRRLRRSLEPSAELRERSALVARVFPAAFIVMGHTHLPEVRPTTENATYVNLGAWAEDDSDDGGRPALPATRTHLVVARGGDELRAELLIWDADGPRPYAEGNRAKLGVRGWPSAETARLIVLTSVLISCERAFHGRSSAGYPQLYRFICR